jgi:hypothetical protein
MRWDRDNPGKRTGCRLMYDPITRKFVVAPQDETIAGLRAKVAEALQPGVSPKAGDFWNEVLADHIRNQSRVKAGLDPLVTRWDRNAPEMRFVLQEAA